MTPLLRSFAQNQPMTPVVETMRSLLVNGTAGPKVWTALAWILGLLVVSYLLSVAVYKRKAIEQTALPHGILVRPIDPTVFGMVDGEALLKQILDAIRARDEAKGK